MNSQSEQETLEEESLHTRKKKTSGRPTFMTCWKLETKFPDENAAFDHLTTEEIWSVDPRRCYSTQTGRKIHYRCNRTNITGALCHIMKCLFFPNNSNEVWLYKIDSIHHHDKTSPAGNNKYFRRQMPKGRIRKKFHHPMESSLKLRISKLLNEIESPKEIMRQLESEGFEVNNREIQIQNFCSSIRHQRNISKWKFEKKFTEVDEAKIYLKRQKIWNFKFQNHSQVGLTYHYRCNLVPKAGPQCQARKYFKFNKFTNEVILYQKDCPHTHKDIIRSTHQNINTKTNWLLKQLHKWDRINLKNQSFRVLDGVGLQDCLAMPSNYSTSFHEKLFTLQQDSSTNFDYENKEEVVTDDKIFTIPVEENLYEGSDENNKKLNHCKRRSQKPHFTADWIYEETFPNEQMALEHLAKDKIWRIDPRRVYCISGGRKVHYRCNQVKIYEPQCAAWKCLLYSVDSDEILLYKTISDHTHDTIEVQFRKSNSSIRRCMLKQRQKLQGTNASGHTKILKKRGRPIKYPRNIITKDESIKNPIKSELLTNDSSDPHIFIDSNTNLMEFVTGDDSIQYVINYIDDEQITNTDDKPQDSQITGLPSECNQQITVPTSPNNYQQSEPGAAVNIPLLSDNSGTITCHDISVNELMEIDNDNDYPINKILFSKNNEWRLEYKISSKDMVPSYLNKQNTWRCKYRSGRNARVRYYCTTVKCAAQMCLVYETGTRNEVLVYRQGKHNHDIANETNDLPLYSNRNELIPNKYVNSNIIMKEELIIDDGSIEVTQNEIDAIDCNVNTNADEVICSKKASKQKWNFEKKFANMEDANKLIIESNELWEIKSTSNRKLFYRCTYPCEPECPAQIFFLTLNSCDVVLYFSGDPHVHPEGRKAILSSTTTGENIMLDRNTKVPISESSSAQTICNILVKNNSDNPTPKVNEFTFKEKFPNLTTAREKMYQETDSWVPTCTRRFKNEYRQYYWCNYNNGLEICTSRVFLLGKNDSDEVFYYTRGTHMHDVNMSKGQITEIINPAKPINVVQHKINLNESKINEIPNTVKSTECSADLIILDESDKDSLNGDDVENNLDKWVFETKFDDYKTAKHYMTNLNLVTFKSNTSKYGVKEYYTCNFVTKDTGHCPPSKYLLYEDLNSGVLMYNMNIQHKNNCSNVIPPLVPIQKRLANVIDLVDSDDNDADNELNVIMLSESDDENTPASEQDILLNAENTWILEKEFENSYEAVEYLKDKQIWSFKFKTKSKEGVKEFYRCNLTKIKGIQCAAAKCLHTKYSLKGTCLYQTEQNHTHDPRTLAAQANRVYESLDNATKHKIKELVKAGNTPGQILDMLKLDKHLYYSINKMGEIMNAKIAQDNSSFSKSIENWLSQITTIPESQNAHYCVDFNVNFSNQSFQCFLSTRRLLLNAVDANIVHLDSRCTFQWQKNPITLVGTTDLDQQFHVFGISICSHKYERDYEFMFNAIRKGVMECYKKIFKPECLMFDDNEAIRHAFIKTFGISSKIGTYSNVVLHKIIYKLSTCSDAVMKEEIKNDILKMQKLSTQGLFFKAADLFFRKWRPIGDEKLKEFLNYFKSNWIDRNPNWFQGFRPFTPITNTAIRREFESLKKNYTFKYKLPLQSFRYHIQVETEQLSCRYALGNSHKQFVRKTTIPISVYEKAIEWNNLEKHIEIVHRNAETCYYISTGDDGLINEEKLQKYRLCNHQSFEEFFDVQTSFWLVQRLKNSGTLTCTCPFFLEKFVCKHTVGLASILNITQYSPSVNQIFLNSKTKTCKIVKKL